MEKYLVLDIGGSAIKYAILDHEAIILEKSSVKTPLDRLESLIETIVGIYNQYESEINGLAISLPGVLDSDTGVMYSGGSLLFNEGHNLIEILQKHCPKPITIENDGKCAALAEIWQGSMKGIKDGVVIVLGTGVGGGIIIDGKLHKGHHFYAGEFSFIRTNSTEPDNFKYCWGYQSGNHTLTVAGARVKEVEEMDGHQFFKYANEGDQDILTILDEFTANIALQILNLQLIISPQRVAIGGGISTQPILIEYIKNNVNKLSEVYGDKFKIFRPDLEIVPCQFRNDSNLLGALYHHLKHTS